MPTQIITLSQTKLGKTMPSSSKIYITARGKAIKTIILKTFSIISNPSLAREKGVFIPLNVLAAPIIEGEGRERLSFLDLLTKALKIKINCKSSIAQFLVEKS